jgi:amino acid adenylation domain-containing protein
MSHPAGPPPESDDTFDLLAQMLDEAGVAPAGADAISRRADASSAPMSFAQELLWLLDRATPGMTAYNMPLARRLRGVLDVGALQAALDTVAARHEALRTRLTDVNGEARQVIDAPHPVAMQRVDANGATPEAREADAARIVRDRARTPFDLAAEPCFRATLVALAPDDHVLVIETHHIAMDGWSMGLVNKELADAYAAAKAGRTLTSPAPALHYGDFAAWQRERLAGDRLQELLTFWRAQLGDATEPLDLPTDRARARVATFEGARESLTYPAVAFARLQEALKGQGVTLYMALLAAYATVLHRYTGRDNVLMGSGSAGRTQHETEQMVGYLNNTLVQRADFTGDPTLAELLERVKASALGAYDHQDIPLEKLALELRQGADRLAPLFDVVLTMQNVLPSAVAFEGLEVGPFGVDLGATKFDITLLPSERPEGLVLTLQYRSDLFLPASMRRFLGHLVQVLDAISAAPATRVSALSLLSATERSELAAFNTTAVNEGDATNVVALFEQQVARVAGRLAVAGPRAAATAAGSVAGTQPLTYTELNARANQLAAHLRTLGVANGAPVGLLLDRSADAIVGLVGILKAGGAYVPLATEAPAARLAQQLRDAEVRCVVTHDALVARLPEGTTVVALDRDATTLGALSEANVATAIAPDAPAHILYTSGSTGTPKGVVVTHANIVHYTRAVSRVLGNVPAGTPGDGLAALDGWRFGMISTLAADLGNTSLYPALLAGGTLHVLSKDVATEPARFAEYVGVHQLDVLKITPNHLAALIAGKAGAELAAVLPRQWIVTGGEALRPAFARTLLSANRCRVLNHYGPTETTVGVCTFEATADSLAEIEGLGAQTVPVGRPIANTTAVVVDRYDNEQPLGVPGELLIGGAGVAQGYLKRPELTAEKFVTWHGARVYRTGDRARRLANGTVEFLGRADDQVKVRGYRVELGEIEQVLRANPGVAQGVAVIRVDEQGEPQLVAYAVAKAAGYAVSHADRPTREKLMEWLAAQLPAFMVPSAVVLLEALPLTANGKVDKAQLPAPDASLVAVDTYVAPRTETEIQLAAIWAEVLKKDRVGLNDNFLDLGGHSLMAIRVLGKISKAFEVRLPLRTLFDEPTVAQIAAVVDADRAKPAAGKTLGAISRDAHRIGNPATGGNAGRPDGAQ